MCAGYNRRKFIMTGGSLLLLLPLAEYCNNGPKQTDIIPRTKGNKTARHIRKFRKPPVNMKMVTNRGWYRNTRNGKIHFFDERGFTPSLEYVKNGREFENFVKHLEPWDARQLTLETFQKNVSKKKKDWITEQAALVFCSTGNYEAAAEVISGRIEKRHLNVRMWDMLAMISLKTANEKLVSNQAALMAKYNSTDNKLLSARFSRYKEEGWQQKVRNKDFKWDNLKI